MAAAAAAPSPNFSIYIQLQTGSCEKMCEWRGRSNAAPPVELKSAGRADLHLYKTASVMDAERLNWATLARSLRCLPLQRTGVRVDLALVDCGLQMAPGQDGGSHVSIID
ncbi:uncharacterized protein V6R79_024073 [Siganus canaliculatus]